MVTADDIREIKNMGTNPEQVAAVLEWVMNHTIDTDEDIESMAKEILNGESYPKASYTLFSLYYAFEYAIEWLRAMPLFVDSQKKLE